MKLGPQAFPISFSYKEQAGTCWPPMRVSEPPVLLVGDRLLQDGFRGEVERCGRAARRVAPVYDALPMRVLRRTLTESSKSVKATAIQERARASC